MPMKRSQGSLERHGLSGYDAAYLETAIRRRTPLSTLDKKLADAAASERVSRD